MFLRQAGQVRSEASPQPAGTARTAIASTPAPSVPVTTFVEEYRGYDIFKTRSAEGVSYSATGLKTRRHSRAAMKITINEAELARYTGIREPALLELFLKADENYDAELSWGELAHFQDRLFRTYAYKSNGYALHPEEFLRSGGGDCEDWALLTAALLRYWNVSSWIASVDSEAGSHAVVFIRYAKWMGNVTRITVEPSPTGQAETYVPIDYSHVGGFSNAVRGSFRITDIWEPERIYGWKI
jgi:hypothetical protein